MVKDIMLQKYLDSLGKNTCIKTKLLVEILMLVILIYSIMYDRRTIDAMNAYVCICMYNLFNVS